MTVVNKFVVFLFLTLCIVIVHGSVHERTSLLNTCMDGKHHKSEPGPEIELHKCNAWQNNSCCTNHTAFYANNEDAHLYSFNMSHCGKMSDNCLNWFHDNNCFYECSPNLGPWLESVKSSFRNEKIVNVPLCKSQCDSWWSACANESTCVMHWNNGFEWTKKPRAMHCPKDKPCRSFTEIFGNATFFCESVYEHDFKVVDDEEPCMKLRFTGSNPNIEVAEHYAEKKKEIESEPEEGDKIPNEDSSITSSPKITTTTTSPNNNSKIDHGGLPPYKHPSETPPLKVHGTVASIVIAILLIIAACGVLAYFGIKRFRGPTFTHQGVPVQFSGSIFRPKAFTPVSSTGDDQMAEMSFMQYDDEEEAEPEEDSTPKLNGTLQMKL